MQLQSKIQLNLQDVFSLFWNLTLQDGITWETKTYKVKYVKQRKKDAKGGQWQLNNVSFTT